MVTGGPFKGPPCKPPPLGVVIDCLGLDDDVRGVEGLDERLGEMVRVDFDGFGLECVDPVGRVDARGAQ